MSTEKISFINNNLCGLGEVYDTFPERLTNIVLEKNVSIYNELYDMLTTDEKRELQELFFENEKTEGKRCLEIKVEPEIRERFANMPRTVLRNRI